MVHRLALRTKISARLALLCPFLARWRVLSLQLPKSGRGHRDDNAGIVASGCRSRHGIFGIGPTLAHNASDILPQEAGQATLDGNRSPL
jgi:hypothetical protein